MAFSLSLYGLAGWEMQNRRPHGGEGKRGGDVHLHLAVYPISVDLSRLIMTWRKENGLLWKVWAEEGGPEVGVYRHRR